MNDLQRSYALCASSARSAASHFYYSFYLLSREKRQAMCALYAYLRKTDDLGDSPQSAEVRSAALAAWRASLERAFAGEIRDPLFPALVDTVGRYRIPRGYLFDVIDGVEMDLESRRYATFADLEHYCERVASAVGLACIHIWGFHSELALEPARKCGVAFQLTNILRDLKEDALRGRVYLPEEDFARFEYTADELRASVCNAAFRRMMAFQLDRAERLYAEAESLTSHLEPDGVRVFDAMRATYHRLLEEIRLRDGDVFTERVTLSRWQKLRIAARCALSRPKAAQRAQRNGAANGSGRA